MKLLIAGGTGQLGSLLAREFQVRGHEVVILSRRETRDTPWRVRKWDAQTITDWIEDLDGCDVLINLCGRSVDCRYTPANRRAILDSRVAPTRLLGKAARRVAHPPKIWLQASTATIYAHRYDAPNDEDLGLIGGNEPDAPTSWGFSIKVAQQWETAAQEECPATTRLVLLRAAMVMGQSVGGVFDKLLRITRCGLGGKAGSGNQYVSWIHERDFFRALLWTIDHPQIEGPLNVCSPNPLPNAEFMAVLRKASGTSVGLPAPRWLLEIGAFFLRTETELLLKSRRVSPTRLLRSGFTFDYPDWPNAAEALCDSAIRRQSNSTQLVNH